MIGTYILTGLVIFLVYYLFVRKGKENAVPEPFGLPLIGHMFMFGGHLPKKCAKWAKKYGKIMKIRLGNFDDVIIDDAALAKEIYNDLDFSGKPDTEFFNAFADGRNGILFNDGPTWQEQRRFTLWHLRDFGFGKKDVMEVKMTEEIVEFIEKLKKEEGKPLVLDRMFNVAVLNTLWSIITGQRYSQDDPQVTRLIDNFQDALDKVVGRLVGIFFPSLAKMFPNVTGWGGFEKSLKELRDYFTFLINEHKKDLQEGDPRDFIDAYLSEIKRTQDPNSSFYKEKGEQNFLAVLADLFQAGFAATSVTINWGVLYLASYPEVQKKFQDELDRVIGKSRLPSMDDKPNLPYTEALMMEILRMSSGAGLVSAHTALKDKIFHGYEIKKGTFVSVNVYSIHHNPETWKDPENFRPERFIDSEGNCVKRHDALMPFSVGKRVCLGESLGRDEMYLFLVSLFQRFTFKPDPNSPAPTLEGKWKGFLAPYEYKVIVKDRL